LFDEISSQFRRKKLPRIGITLPISFPVMPPEESLPYDGQVNELCSKKVSSPSSFQPLLPTSLIFLIIPSESWLFSFILRPETTLPLVRRISLQLLPSLSACGFSVRQHAAAVNLLAVFRQKPLPPLTQIDLSFTATPNHGLDKGSSPFSLGIPILSPPTWYAPFPSRVAAGDKDCSPFEPPNL